THTGRGRVRRDLTARPAGPAGAWPGSCGGGPTAIRSTGMKPTVYVETTVPSYLTAWPSRDVVRAGEQQVTRDWWTRRGNYELRVSSLVLLECGAGDAEAAALRLATLDGVPVLAQTPEAEALAETLLREVPLPVRAAADALHV